MLTGVLRVIVNKPFKEIFYITFMENWKSCQNIIFFPIKTF